MRSQWSSTDDRLPHRARDDSNLPPHSMEERNMPPPTMMASHAVQPPDPMYQQQLPPPSEMWPQVPREPMMAVPPPAPRQRTAIACRYCRRRKIRCSGFDSSADGRCGNCLRFNQECVFTPVSSHSQAFVPAHTQYPHLKQGFIPPRGGPARPVGQLYGSYGQPLPLHAALPQPSHQGDYPHHNYVRPPSPGHASQYNQPYDDPSYDRRRDDRPPSLPPLAPNNYPPHSMLQRRGSAGDYPAYWSGTNANPPSSPPATLPPPRQYSPPRNNSYTNGNFPSGTLPPQSRSYPTGSYERPYAPNGQSNTVESPQTTGPPQRRLSDPRGNEPRKEQGSSYPAEGAQFPYNPPAPRPAPGPLQSPPRSSSAGPLPSHPMQLSNLIDHNPPHRSDVDARMLKSLNFKT
ncbi:hypothetical protein DRE_07643 [Drechslerella stenobrocha 248]|uniref:Zn(2)-C6 fungal-type domain-containing protein n=1 Tax=Drechslerella stenobrocha 248 TaxID=1043628 RepID=W7I3W1_9PEZI|nr:hypothetical protein DRE_07643 [Drechslerella stenobrocha 248]